MILKIQQDAMDCGPSCLAMIVKYYGKDVRKFFYDLKNNKVSEIYIKILKFTASLK